MTLTCFLTTAARAEDANAERAKDTSPKRELPDYDGRGPKPTTPGDVLIWIPRVLLAPPYFVSEYLIRRPLGFLISAAERSDAPSILYDFFAFGPDHKSGIVPTAYLEFGFRASIGLYLFWDDALLDGHDLRVHAAYAGRGWHSLSYSESFRLGPSDKDRVAIDASVHKRPDYAFFGIGPDSRQSERVRYGANRLEAGLRLDQGAWRSSLFRGEVRVKDVDFLPGSFPHDPSLDAAIQSGALPEPPGYPRGYTIVQSSLAAALDSRRPRPAPGSGVRVVGAVQHASDTRRKDSYVRYGGSVGGYVDLTSHRRVVGLTLNARFADPIQNGEIPFTELISLGGSEAMEGFVQGRLVDRSSLVATLQYRWPIWIWLDGAMRAEVGNVFGEHLAGFDMERLRFSGTLGFASNSSDEGLEFVVGFGTETFESGGKLNSVRFVVTTHGL